MKKEKFLAKMFFYQTSRNIAYLFIPVQAQKLQCAPGRDSNPGQSRDMDFDP